MSSSSPPIDSDRPVWAALQRDLDALVEALAQAVEEQILEYRTLQHQGRGAPLRDSVRRLLGTLLACEHVSDPKLDPVLVELGRQRAAEGVPLTSILHAWRVATHRLWDWYVGEVIDDSQRGAPEMGVWSLHLQLVDRYVTAITEAYIELRSQTELTQLLSASAAVDALLNDASPEHTERTLRWLGIDGPAVVVAVCLPESQDETMSGDPHAIFGPFLAAVSHRRTTSPPWSIRNGRMVVILSADDVQTPGLVSIAAQAKPALRIGISRPGPPRCSLSDYHRQAEMALRTTSALRPVVDTGQMSLLDIVAANTSLRWTDAPEWLRTFFAEDARHNHEWTSTAAALVENASHVGTTAAHLHVHTNTVYYRLNTIRERCGVDLRDPEVLISIQFVLRCLDFGSLPVAQAEIAR